MLIGLGSNFFGQLGLGSRRREYGAHTPVAFGSEDEEHQLNALAIADVQCGSQFTTVLFTDGSVHFTGTLNGSVYPQLLPIQVTIPLRCMQVACGRRHIVLLMERGVVMSYGIGYFGQLGHGDDSSRNSPQVVSALEPRRLGGTHVTSVSCGGHHSGAVTDSGRVFMWGLNRGGQCGQGGKSDSVLEPRPIETSEIGPQKAVILVCGRAHSAIITSSGRLYTWGESGFGRLGSVDVQKFQNIPREVATFRSQPVDQVAAGDFHMLALTREGLVYSWGCGIDGQTGHSTVLNIRTPRRLDYFDSLGVTSIACGACWSMAVTANGNLFAWGCGDGGWLGIRIPPRLDRLEPDVLATSQDAQIVGRTQFRCFDSQFNVLIPQRVRFLIDWEVQYARAGSGHTVIMCSRKRTNSGSEDYKDSSFQSEGVTSSPLDSSYAAEGKESPFLSATERDSRFDSKISSEGGTSYSPVHRHNTADKSIGVDAEHANSSLHLLQLCRHKKAEELQTALDKGADINVRDGAGNTPLIVACQNGHFHICKLLIGNGAQLNLANKKGNTALHYSMNYGYEDIGKYLIESGADEFLTNAEGLTCYEGLTQSDLDLL